MTYFEVSRHADLWRQHTQNGMWEGGPQEAAEQPGAGSQPGLFFHWIYGVHFSRTQQRNEKYFWVGHFVFWALENFMKLLSLRIFQKWFVGDLFFSFERSLAAYWREAMTYRKCIWISSAVERKQFNAVFFGWYITIYCEKSVCDCMITLSVAISMFY